MSLRPSDPKKVTFADLELGDVLLSCGDSPLDQLITLIDCGDYSHLSLVTELKGADGKPWVVEATTGGSKYQSVDAGIDTDMGAQYLIDVYRYVSPERSGFKDPGWPVAPVIGQAMGFVGANYAYSELGLVGAVLWAVNESGTTPDVGALLRLGAQALVEELVQRWKGASGSGKIPMTCVQIATAAFWQADAEPVNKYGLKVQSVRSQLVMTNAVTASADQMAKWRVMRDQINDVISEAVPHMAMTRRAASASAAAAAESIPGVVVAGSSVLPAGMCTSRDMETSPSLKFVGCLKDTGMRPIAPPGG